MPTSRPPARFFGRSGADAPFGGSEHFVPVRRTYLATVTWFGRGGLLLLRTDAIRDTASTFFGIFNLHRVKPEVCGFWRPRAR